MADYEMIATRADLDALAQDLLGESVIAVDTEADSFYHYFDKTCLIQIGTPKRTYLVDPLALGGPANLAPLGPIEVARLSGGLPDGTVVVAHPRQIPPRLLPGGDAE